MQRRLVLGLGVELHGGVGEDGALLRRDRRAAADAQGESENAAGLRRDDGPRAPSVRSPDVRASSLSLLSQKYTPRPPAYVCAFLYESADEDREVGGLDAHEDAIAQREEEPAARARDVEVSRA